MDLATAEDTAASTSRPTAPGSAARRPAEQPLRDPQAALLRRTRRTGRELGWRRARRRAEVHRRRSVRATRPRVRRCRTAARCGLTAPGTSRDVLRHADLRLARMGITLRYRTRRVRRPVAPEAADGRRRASATSWRVAGRRRRGPARADEAGHARGCAAPSWRRWPPCAPTATRSCSCDADGADAGRGRRRHGARSWTARRCCRSSARSRWNAAPADEHLAARHVGVLLEAAGAVSRRVHAEGDAGAGGPLGRRARRARAGEAGPAGQRRRRGRRTRCASTVRTVLDVRRPGPARPRTTPCTRCGSAAAGSAATCGRSARWWTRTGPTACTATCAGSPPRSAGPRRRGAARPAAPHRRRRSAVRARCRGRGRRSTPSSPPGSEDALAGAGRGAGLRRGTSALLDVLVDAARAPRLTELGAQPSAVCAADPGWSPSAGASSPSARRDCTSTTRTSRGTTTRIRAKRARYAAEAVGAGAGQGRGPAGQGVRRGAGRARRAPGRGHGRRRVAGIAAPMRTTLRWPSPRPAGRTRTGRRAPGPRRRSPPPGTPRAAPKVTGWLPHDAGDPGGRSGVWRAAGERRGRGRAGAPAAVRRLVAAEGQARPGRAPADGRVPRGRGGDGRDADGSAAGCRPCATRCRPGRSGAEGRRLLGDACARRRRPVRAQPRGGRGPVAPTGGRGGAAHL